MSTAEALLDAVLNLPCEPADPADALGGGQHECSSGGGQPSTSSPAFSTGAIKRVNYSHAAMIDQILANPGISQNALAAMFGYSPGWVSMVMSSDAFQAKLAERSAEIIDPALKLTVDERFKGVMMRSLEILQEKLAAPVAQVPGNFALRSLEVSSKALGFGIKEPPPPPAPVSLNLHIEQMGENLARLLVRERSKVLSSPLLDQILENPT